MANLFFSYSHKDEDLRDELETHLAMLKRQGLVDAVHDRRITAGADLDAAIDGYLEEADVILCLVSPDFLASDYCYSREMGRALERHRAGDARVIPVILRHCDWPSTPLSGLRGTPRDNRPVKAWPDRDEAWLDVTKDIRQALAESAGTSPPDAAAPRSATPGPAAPTPPTSLRPRSSNLAVTREFTDLDRDEYLRQSFDFLAEFFANSLDEVRARADGVEGAVRHLDANRFTASAYRHGRKLAAITVFVGGRAIVPADRASRSAGRRAPPTTRHSSIGGSRLYPNRGDQLMIVCKAAAAPSSISSSPAASSNRIQSGRLLRQSPSYER